MVGGAGETGGGTDEAGAGGSPVCSAIADSPLVDYHQLARPRLIPEGEDERHEA